ncbi:MAG: nuclear transport factor 2 family protein, partial [Gemmatimonadaceae bacterium]
VCSRTASVQREQLTLRAGKPSSGETSMIRLSRSIAGLIAATLGMSATAQYAAAQTSQDQADVRRAVLDYVEGFYEGDTAKLVRSIRPEVYKYGFWRHRDSTSYAGEQMTWSEIIGYAKNVKANNRQAPASAPKEVALLEVLDQTASAKLTASWGIDYLLLGKFAGRWMITHVLWQSPPRSKTS